MPYPPVLVEPGHGTPLARPLTALTGREAAQSLGVRGSWVLMSLVTRLTPLSKTLSSPWSGDGMERPNPVITCSIVCRGGPSTGTVYGPSRCHLVGTNSGVV